MWLQRQLHALKREEVGHVVLSHHHPYIAMPYWVPDYFSMDSGTFPSASQLLRIV